MSVYILINLPKKMKNEDLDAKARTTTVTFGIDFCLLSFDQVLKIVAVLFDCNTHDKVRTWYFLEL